MPFLRNRTGVLVEYSGDSGVIDTSLATGPLPLGRDFMGIPTAATMPLVIEDPDTGDFEIGNWTFDGVSLTRHGVLDSYIAATQTSSATAPVSFVAGEKRVFLDVTAEALAELTEIDGDVTGALGTNTITQITGSGAGLVDLVGTLPLIQNRRPPEEYSNLAIRAMDSDEDTSAGLSVITGPQASTPLTLADVVITDFSGSAIPDNTSSYAGVSYRNLVDNTLDTQVRTRRGVIEFAAGSPLETVMLVNSDGVKVGTGQLDEGAKITLDGALAFEEGNNFGASTLYARLVSDQGALLYYPPGGTAITLSDTGGGGVQAVNGISPDGFGDVEIGLGDLQFGNTTATSALADLEDFTYNTLSGDVNGLVGDVSAIEAWPLAGTGVDNSTIEVNLSNQLTIVDGSIGGSLIADTGVPTSKLALAPANTFLANVTSSTASPSAVGVPGVRAALGMHPTGGFNAWGKSTTAYGLPGYSPTQVTSNTIFADSCDLTPFVAPADCRLTDVGFMVSAAASAGGVAQIELFNATWNLDGFQPTTRIAVLAANEPMDVSAPFQINLNVSAQDIQLVRGRAYCVVIGVSAQISATRHRYEDSANLTQNIPAGAVYQNVIRVRCDVYPPPSDLTAQAVILTHNSTTTRPYLDLTAVIKLEQL